MTSATGSKRLRKEEAAIAALLAEPTIAGAAVKAGVSERTLVRWLQEPAFKTQYRAARRSLVESAVARLQQAASDAVDALSRNLSCGTPAVEVGAAKAILDQAIKGVELVDLVERVEQLEQVAATSEDRGDR